MLKVLITNNLCIYQILGVFLGVNLNIEDMNIKSLLQADWRKAMLDTLNIKEDFYKSKYKEVASDLPSSKSEIFVEKRNYIFENI